MPAPTPISIPVVTPAKINLYLGVGPLRDDGYHELATVFQALELCDHLVVTASRSGMSVEVEGRPPMAVDVGTVPTDSRNLGWRAAELLIDRFDLDKAVNIIIEKAIPVAGGMAGGSSDAAGVLVGCNALWGLNLSLAELTELGAELGSDVPFCLHGGTALGASRGEVLTPVLATGTFHWVVATSFGELSTPAVYRRFDELQRGSETPRPEVPTDLLMALRAGDAPAVGRCLHNDLQPAAISLMPELDLLLESGIDYGALGAMVSGSGPTCLFLARDASHAVELSLALSTTGLCSSARMTQGPAPGARVLVAPPDLAPVVIE